MDIPDRARRWSLQVATGLLELNTLIPFCIEERANFVSSAPVVCFSPHRSLFHKTFSKNMTDIDLD